MTRPKKWIPLTDIKGLSTLVGENKTQKEIVEYYSEHGLHYDQTTISIKIKKMVTNKENDEIMDNTEDLKESYKYASSFAQSLGWSDERLNKALGNMNSIEIIGSKAGTSLRWILYILEKNNEVLQEYCKIYKISYSKIDPNKNSFIQILKVFADNNVKSRDIGDIFGNYISFDFIDLCYAYKMGKIADD